MPVVIETTMLLDKVQRKERVSRDQITYLRKQKLIEGRSPNIYIAAFVAAKTGQKASYIKNRGLDKEFYKRQIIECIKKFGSATREDIDKLILEKLPDVLNEIQKKMKLTNLLTELKNEGKIINVATSRRYSKWELCN